MAGGRELWGMEGWTLASLMELWREGIFSVEFGSDSENSFEVKAKLEVTQ